MSIYSILFFRVFLPFPYVSLEKVQKFPKIWNAVIKLLSLSLTTYIINGDRLEFVRAQISTLAVYWNHSGSLKQYLTLQGSDIIGQVASQNILIFGQGWEPPTFTYYYLYWIIICCEGSFLCILGCLEASLPSTPIRCQ